MHIATHIIKIKGKYDGSWDEKKLRAYVDLKIKNEIEDVLHPDLELFEAKEWIKDHIKEEGLSVTEFTVEMIFNMCSPNNKFGVITS